MDRIEANTLTFAHKWIIQQFTALYTESTLAPAFLISENFSPFARDQLDTYIELCPNGTENTEHFLGIFLGIDASYLKDELMIKYKLSILDKHGETFCCKESQNILQITGRFGWDRYIRIDHLLNSENEILLSDHQLTIFCEVSISSSKKSFSTESSQIEQKITRSYCDAQTRLSTFHHKWLIDNLNHFRNENDLEYYPVNSSDFDLENSSKQMQFYLKLYPLNADNVLKVYLFFKSKVISQVKVQFRLTIFRNTNKIWSMSCQEYLSSGKGFGWPIEMLPKNSSNSRLLILCEAQINQNYTVSTKSHYLNENINTAISSIYSFTSNLKNIIFQKESKISENNKYSTCLDSDCLVPEIPLSQSYFNAYPKVLDSLIHTWSICNYSEFLDNYEQGQVKVVESTTFKSNRNEKLQFQLRLYPKGHTEKSSNGYNSVYLVYSCVNRLDVKVQLCVSVIDKEGDKRYEKIMRHTFGANVNPFYHEDYLGLYFIQNDYLLNEEEGLMQEDTLTVHCEVQIIDDHEPEFTIKRENSSSSIENGNFEPSESDPLL